ncbi:MAG: hypothetical protein RBU37_23485 [Myxococcota bacterium]|nr:hypothetical protein [Myxococcota bacterium]
MKRGVSVGSMLCGVFGRRFGVMIPLVVLVLLIPRVAPAFTCLVWVGSECISWQDGIAPYRINEDSFVNAFVGDAHLANVDWSLYIGYSARQWAEADAGSGLEWDYAGTTSLGCRDGASPGVVSTTYTPNGALGAAPITWNPQTGAILRANVCINSWYPFSVQEEVPSGRYDIRAVLTHEFGHFIGSNENPNTIMNASLSSAISANELLGDDKAFARWQYGSRSLTVSARTLTPPAVRRDSVELPSFEETPTIALTIRSESQLIRTLGLLWWAPMRRTSTGSMMPLRFLFRLGVLPMPHFFS